MRSETRLLLLATTFGAAVGAYAALRQSGGTPWAAPAPPTPFSTIGHDRNPSSISQQIDGVRALAPPTNGSAAPQFQKLPPGNSLAPPTETAAATMAAPLPSAVASAAPVELADQGSRALSLVAWSAPDDPVKSEQHCIAGEPLECLRLAVMMEGRAQSGLELKQAQTYRERAYSILVLKCHQRNPDACVTIARMHALGFGLPKNPASEKALIDRARALCKGKTTAVCSALVP